jgi:hypothetical protein
LVGVLKRTAIFEWNASTRFVENGKPVAASELKTGERATVNYAPQAARRDRDLAGDKTARAHKTRSTLALRERQLRRGDRRGPGRCRSASGEKQIESISFLP